MEDTHHAVVQEKLQGEFLRQEKLVPHQEDESNNAAMVGIYQGRARSVSRSQAHRFECEKQDDI